MNKPMLKRRTFWIGAATGAVATITAVITIFLIGELAKPQELSQGVTKTWEPPKSTVLHNLPKPIDLGPCDTRGKDCVFFEDPLLFEPYEKYYREPKPKEPDQNYTPEPSTLWLIALGTAALLVKRGSRWTTRWF